MNDYDLIAARYGFVLPPLYRELQAAGCFDYKQPDKYIEFTDHQWLSLESIASHEFCKWQTNLQRFLVPFSHSARRDEWGWRLDWMSGEEPAIVFCERGLTGEGFAPNFRGFLYRMLLEEFSGTWVVENPEDEEGKAKIRRAVDVVCPRLPQEWAQRIEGVSRLPWYIDEDKTVCVYPRAECDRIVAMDLAFPHLDEAFSQELG